MNDKLLKEILTNKEIIQIYKKIEDDERINGWASHGLNHINNVMENTEYLLSRLNYDEKTIENALIAAFLHDIGCINGKENHAMESYKIAKEIFLKYNIKLDNEETILEAIKNHSKGFDSDSIITRTILLADKLDITKERVVGIGNEIEGMKQLSNIEKIDTIVDGNILTIRFITNDKVNIEELENFYFIKKVFKSIESFAKYTNLDYIVTLNGKRWEVK